MRGRYRRSPCREGRVYAAAVRLFLAHPGERRRALLMLFARTAAAFGCPVPRSRARRLRGLLDEYARFTRDQALEALRGGHSLEPIERRLHRAGLAMGRRYRVLLAVRSSAGAMTAARLVYRCLGIDFAGFPGGDVEVRRCSFARFYSPAVCSLVSALDHGLLAGLSNGGDLRFSRRLTEGADICAAHVEGVAA